MFTLAVKRHFMAQHYLIGGDWGAENQKHAHAYALELQLHGAQLDTHNYLVDIVDVERQLDTLIARYRDQTLNNLPEFSGQNPSLELFARHLAQTLAARFHAPTLSALTVRLWENDIAWVTYRLELQNL
jgi:6-pyruvoyltetrahydropterin/6-carboxytetrahydropterin synthase